jgi:chorismate mutase
MVKAVRGATQIEEDRPQEIQEAVVELFHGIVKENEFTADDIISLIISVTDDIHSMNPATALRAGGIDSFPLFCVQEMKTDNQLPRTIRFLLHIQMPEDTKDVTHVYTRGAQVLRPDLQKKN